MPPIFTTKHRCNHRQFSSSRGIFPSDLHSYSKRRFSGPPVSPPLRQWEGPVDFLRMCSKLSLVLFFGILFYLSFPPSPSRGDQCPTVVETCLDLSRWGKFISGFLSGVGGKLVRVGGGGFESVSGNGLKIF